MEQESPKKLIHNYWDDCLINAAGAGLLRWVVAMVNYYEVARTVAPKRRAVAEAEKSLSQAQKDLQKIKEDLRELSEQLSALRAKFNEKTTEQKELKDKADLMERRLDAAERLISGFSSEKVGRIRISPIIILRF